MLSYGELDQSRELPVFIYLLALIFLLPPSTANASQKVCTLAEPLHAGAPRALSGVNTIVLHHTAIRSLGSSLSTLRMRGMAYHYLIGNDGLIVRAVPARRIAYHAAGANRGSIGIAFVGGDAPSWSPSEEQWTAATGLIRDLKKNYSGIRYLVGHGDVRDTNAGEPYNLNFDRLITQLHQEMGVELLHPGSEDGPLRDFRRAALYLLEHPRTPGKVTAARQIREFETLTCPEGPVRVPVTLNPSAHRVHDGDSRFVDPFRKSN
jgi:hypothetical protein